ncbi:MAG: MBL fold metallo-hydrolase [Rhodobacteraceae bacterium]|nr:MBL fold metallo-hydrolase [Paracoccaceae bacterium]
MTFWGTNTYILGTNELAIIDPGPAVQSHFDAIMSSLNKNQSITHILITHSHIDHSPLAKQLSERTSAPILAFGESSTGKSAIMANLKNLEGGEGVDYDFKPDVTLVDNQILKNKEWCIKSLHTPGHMGNHLCFSWEGENILFSGDLVMGWATSMVSPPDGDLTDFMNSIKSLQLRSPDKLFFPGHGAPIKNPSLRLQELYEHRKKREGEILSALETGLATISEITDSVYADLDKRLITAAKRNVLAHLIDLTSRKICTASKEITTNSRFTLTSKG